VGIYSEKNISEKILSSKILELKEFLFFTKISYFPQILLNSKILELKKVLAYFFSEQFLLSQKILKLELKDFFSAKKYYFPKFS